MRAIKASILCVLFVMFGAVYAGTTIESTDSIFNDPSFILENEGPNGLIHCRMGGDGDPPKPPPDGVGTP